jgi:NAD-dependent SIR2 family protein deacetylase
MISKCECQQCGQAIEFEAAQLERSGETPYRTIDCPNCGKPTQLYMMRHAVKPAAKISSTNLWTIIIGLIIIVPLAIFAGIQMWQSPGSTTEMGSMILDIFLVGFSILIYFVPAIVGRNKKNAHAIFILNLLTGWTFIGWVGSLVWACTKD